MEEKLVENLRNYWELATIAGNCTKQKELAGFNRGIRGRYIRKEELV